MRSRIQRLALLVALAVSAVSVSGQDREESRQAPTHIRRECPDTPLRFLNPFSTDWRKTKEEQRSVREATTKRAAECRLRLIVGETRQLAEHIENLYYATDSADLTKQNLDQRSEDIQETADRLSELLNFETAPPQFRTALLPNTSLDLQIRRLVALSGRLIPNLMFFVGSDFYDLNRVNQIRTDLALTKAVSQALTDSTF